MCTCYCPPGAAPQWPSLPPSSATVAFPPSLLSYSGTLGLPPQLQQHTGSPSSASRLTTGRRCRNDGC